MDREKHSIHRALYHPWFQACSAGHERYGPETEEGCYIFTVRHRLPLWLQATSAAPIHQVLIPLLCRIEYTFTKHTRLFCDDL